MNHIDHYFAICLATLVSYNYTAGFLTTGNLLCNVDTIDLLLRILIGFPKVKPLRLMCETVSYC